MAIIVNLDELIGNASGEYLSTHVDMFKGVDGVDGQGWAGPTGPKGDEGDAGTQGVQGPIGEVGLTPAYEFSLVGGSLVANIVGYTEAIDTIEWSLG